MMSKVAVPVMVISFLTVLLFPWTGFAEKQAFISSYDDRAGEVHTVYPVEQTPDPSSEPAAGAKKTDVLLKEAAARKEMPTLARGEVKNGARQKSYPSTQEKSAIEWFRSGTHYFKNRHWHTAILHYSRAIELDPKYANAYCTRGSAYNALGLYKEGLADLNKAIELNPRYDAAYNNRGVALHTLGQYHRAIVDFNKAIEFNPKFETAHHNRGFALHALGKASVVMRGFKFRIEFEI